MNDMTFAVHMYALREFTRTYEELGLTLRNVKHIGYNAIEAQKIDWVNSARFKEMADEIGLRFASVQYDFEQIINNIDGIIKDQKILGCRYVSLSSLPMHYRTNSEGYHAFIKEIEIPVKKIAESNLQFIFHNHKFELEKFGNTTGLDILLNETNPDYFGFELDLCWLQAGGASPVNWIRKVKGRMGVVHMKDMGVCSDNQIITDIGQGNMDWPEIIRACRETNVEWYIVEQDMNMKDPFKHFEISYDYLSNYF